MNFAIYLPPQAENSGAKLPVIYWLVYSFLSITAPCQLIILLYTA